MDVETLGVSEKRKFVEDNGEFPINGEVKTVAITPGPKRKKIKRRKNPNVERTPLMLFNETFPQLEIQLVKVTGPSHEPEFVMAIEFEGGRFEGHAKSKKGAKQVAAAQFLQSKGLLNSSPVSTPNNVTDNLDGVLHSSPVKLTREQTIVKAINDGVNVVSIVHQYYPGAKFKIVDEVGKAHSKIFTSELHINGETYQGTGANKKSANLSAAARAMFQLHGVIHSTNNKDISDPSDLEFLIPQPLADKIGEMVQQKFALLTESSNTPAYRYKVLAGVVKTIQKGEEVVEMEVISIGTGTKCITGENISNTGLALNDCHGEIIARRGLCNYLYEQLDLALAGQINISCFTKKNNGLFGLREDVAFHLYISTSPCGDGRIFSPKEKALNEPEDRHPQRKTRGLLRTKIENGEGTVPVRIGGVFQTWDGVLVGERLLTMSCSDKIAKWNVVGLQGALLSRYIEPVYLTSVVLGSLYNFHHLTRALYKRLGVLANLPDLYHHNYHLVNGISVPEARGTGKSPSSSLNWSWGKEGLEIVNACTGKLEDGNPSRLCKEVFFKKFIALWNKEQPAVSFPFNYNEAKLGATSYKKAFQSLVRMFESKGLGKWVAKPIEQDDF